MTLKIGQKYASEIVVVEVRDIDTNDQKCLLNVIATASKLTAQPGDTVTVGIDTFMAYFELYEDVKSKYYIDEDHQDLWRRTKQFIGGGR